jgi:hypothetical protein
MSSGILKPSLRHALSVAMVVMMFEVMTALGRLFVSATMIWLTMSREVSQKTTELVSFTPLSSAARLKPFAFSDEPELYRLSNSRTRLWFMLNTYLAAVYAP